MFMEYNTKEEHNINISMSAIQVLEKLHENYCRKFLENSLDKT